MLLAMPTWVSARRWLARAVASSALHPDPLLPVLDDRQGAALETQLLQEPRKERRGERWPVGREVVESGLELR
jgi:hypothetical protein